MPLPDTINAVNNIDFIIFLIIVIGTIYSIIVKKKDVKQTLWDVSLIPKKGDKNFWTAQLLALILIFVYVIFIIITAEKYDKLEDVPKTTWALISAGGSIPFIMMGHYGRQQAREIKGKTGAILKLTSKLAYIIAFMLIVGGIMLIDPTISGDSTLILIWYVLIIVIVVFAALISTVADYAKKFTQIKRAWSK